jgi:hypothetical protein
LKEKKLEQLREELNKLIKEKEAVLHKDKILEVSQELDELIVKSYKEV